MLPPESLDSSSGPSLMTRVVQIGGVSREELRAMLSAAGVWLNEAAEVLFADDRFATSPNRIQLQTVQLSVAVLGLPNGGTFDQVVKRAAERGLLLCPLELGPHLRHQFLDQPEGFLGHPKTEHTAPAGSITVASKPLSQDEETPKGFYLRRIAGELWLRGYRSGPEHIWNPQDIFVFAPSL